MRTAFLACCVVLLAGCSFLQDWGALRSGSDAGGGGMDGGAVDGGDRDAGADAGEPCNVCEAQGCDPTDSSICVEDGTGCFVCDLPGLGEGERCTIEEDCEDRLTCQQGLCLTPCATHEDCGASAIGDFCGVGDRTEPVCVARDCLPTEGLCDEGRICTIFYDFEDPSGSPHLGSACLPPYEDVLSGGDPCDGSRPCPDGFRCEADQPDGMPGSRRCLAYCFLDDPTADCALGETCRGIVTSSPEVFFQDRQLGYCVPATGSLHECVLDTDCLDADLGDLCRAGRCLRGCTADADCVGPNRCVTISGVGFCSRECGGAACTNGLACTDLNMDSVTECYPGCDGSDCPAGYACLDAVCVLSCSGPGDCPIHAPQCLDVNADGTFECVPAPLCTDPITCPAGLEVCRDANEDGATECNPS